MRRALALARRGFTSPNPMVGAVVVKGPAVVGEGFHPFAGAPHAEVVALERAGDDAGGADLYVTLEPCCHFGRTPPCVDAVIKSGVRRVFAAMIDPNPSVAGKGREALEKAGIEVRVGLLEEEARRLNEAYIKHVTTGLPFVTLKMAMTLDGKIAARTGDSRWISCEASRRYVHRLRARSDAVAVGLGTVLADDPELTARGVRFRQMAPHVLLQMAPHVLLQMAPHVRAGPCRVVVDGLAETPPDARLFSSPGGEVVIAVTSDAPAARVAKLEQAGARIVVMGSGQLVDLTLLARRLGEEQVTSLLIEGGGELAASALEAGIADKVLIFIAPRIVGGREAKTPVEGLGASSIAEGILLERMSVRRLDCDILVEAYVHRTDS